MGSESHTETFTVKVINEAEVECVKCESCCLTEECTLAYISKVRHRYQGRWLCGLCGEAVKDEVVRSKKLITTEEALNQHINFYREFRSSSSAVLNKTEPKPPIIVISRILLRSLDSPRPPLSSN